MFFGNINWGCGQECDVSHRKSMNKYMIKASDSFTHCMLKHQCCATNIESSSRNQLQIPLIQFSWMTRDLYFLIWRHITIYKYSPLKLLIMFVGYQEDLTSCQFARGSTSQPWPRWCGWRNLMFSQIQVGEREWITQNIGALQKLTALKMDDISWHALIHKLYQIVYGII